MLEQLAGLVSNHSHNARTGEGSIYLPMIATIAAIRTETATEKVFTVRLPDGEPLGQNPGQFVMVSLPGVGEAPISIMSSPSRTGETFDLCIRKVGDLTGVIHTLVPGDQIGIRGPFGRGFPMEVLKGKDILAAAGGLGMPRCDHWSIRSSITAKSMVV